MCLQSMMKIRDKSNMQVEADGKKNCTQIIGLAYQVSFLLYGFTRNQNKYINRTLINFKSFFLSKLSLNLKF